jgi:hypothetical protein
MSSSIPEDVATLVRSAGAAAPPYTGSLEQVRGRVTARRRHLFVGSLASVLAVALAVGLPYAVLRPSAVATLTPASTPPVVEPPPAQRLFLRVAGFVATPGDFLGEPPASLDPSKPNFGYPPGSTGLVSLGGLKELLPDGSVVTHAAGGDLVRPDGKFVALYPHDLAPGTSRTDGPCVAHVEMLLEVRAADGSVSVSRDVREMCQVVILVGASDEEAYLVRAPADAQGFPLTGARLVAHRFADGVERDVVGLDALSGTVNDLNLAAGLAASVTDGCRLVVASTSTGAVVSSVSVSPSLPLDGHCDRVRLSPDGRLAAVTVEKLPSPGGGREGWVHVIDLATGSALTSVQVYASTAGEEQRKIAPKGFAGLAWVDDTHVRVAHVDPPAEDRIVTIDESARAVTLHVA